MLEPLKRHAINGVLKLLSHPTVTKILSDPRIMKVVGKGIELPVRIANDIKRRILPGQGK